MRRLPFIFLCLLMLMPLEGYSQRTSKTIQKEKQETAKKIDRTKRQINDNLEQTRTELRNLQTIEGNIKAQRGEVSRINQSISSVNQQSRLLSDSIDANTRKLGKLKESYANSLQTLRRQHHVSSPTLFILSSKTFSQAKSRARYLRELNDLQKEKALSLKETSARLSRQHADLDSLRSLLSRSLDSVATVERQLTEQKHKADAIVGSLKRQGKNLNKVLREQEERARRLDEELNRIIEEEAQRSKKEPGKKPADTKLTGSFASNKGRLPWPIDRSATVVSEFGRHQHAEYEKVEIQNNGIDFETTTGAQATAVFPGTVSMVIVMDGYENVVLLRHGEYLTVYAGIDGVKVRKGQKIEAGQSLGSIYSNPNENGRTRLHFEVRHEKEKLNPSQWLRP